ncbi:4a-hydroxytetrahydrobiopterin dehydratase [Agrococcus sp. HG114]|uniref:4a-hydroxytetrahydrobiopterin dehydratase n=1 Tax=Agrococcus sp. HG114 TaxID=2969757 RepID=UPI00215B00B7|nr:4a-hydroxytetrahydrobiopterin dehydratase [Agrococcus sp. HG114]MCR8670795.1 4a-hydroxytetrahydrobiopterin dehydratase [Agrococcus sp. HG114]
MSDPKAPLSETEIDEAGLAGWRRSGDALVARFRSKTFAAGLELVNRIGAAAEAANHHPDVTLTYGAVEVRLSSHDVGAITIRDVRLAREISDQADSMRIAVTDP